MGAGFLPSTSRKVVSFKMVVFFFLKEIEPASLQPFGGVFQASTGKAGFPLEPPKGQAAPGFFF